MDYNGAQIDGKTNEVCSIEPVAEKWKAFGWHVIEVKNGNSCEEINDALKIAQNIKNKPCIIIAKTVKGYGVSFIEKAGVNNHSMNISKEQLELALEELKK